jgi:hypothetical protein
MMGKVIYLEDMDGVVPITEEEFERESYCSFGGGLPSDYEVQAPNKSGEEKE